MATDGNAKMSKKQGAERRRMAYMIRETVPDFPSLLLVGEQTVKGS